MAGHWVYQGGDNGGDGAVWVEDKPAPPPPASINPNDPNAGGAGATVNYCNLADPNAGPAYSLNLLHPDWGYQKYTLRPGVALGGDNGGTPPEWVATGQYYSLAQLRALNLPGYGMRRLNGTWGEGSGSSILGSINWGMAAAVIGVGGLMGAFGEVAGLAGEAVAAPADVVGYSAGGALESGGALATDGTVYSISEGAANMDVMEALDASTGNFGDWIQADSGTMYNPQTGEYLLQDGTYNAGSTGAMNSSGTYNVAPGGADAYYSPGNIFGSGGLSSSTPGVSSLDDILGKATKAVAAIGKAVSGYKQATRNNLAPRYNVGSANLGLIALAGLAFLAFKG